MTELLDAFADDGLDDAETVGFIVEALANAEEDDWPDILEPFLPPERSLAVLAKVPNVVRRTVDYLASVEARNTADADRLAAAREEKTEVARRFLETLEAGVLQCVDPHSVARWARLCRVSRNIASTALVWEPRARALFAVWGVAPSPSPGGDWREAYYSTLRPRFDGAYVAQAEYAQFIVPGSSMDMVQNAKEVNSGKHFTWIDYRRFLRLYPPHPDDGSHWCLIFQDTCDVQMGEDTFAGIDPRTHLNPEKSVAKLLVAEQRSVTNRTAVYKDKLRERVCAGRYKYSVSDGKLDIEYATGNGVFNMELRLSHGGVAGPGFSSELEWRHYQMIGADASVDVFDLGRKKYFDGSRVEGSPPDDPKKNHFPNLHFRPQTLLEHLL